MLGAFGGWDTGLWALVPTICACAVFWFVMRGIIRSDRTEREAQARIEAAEDALALRRAASDAAGARGDADALAAQRSAADPARDAADGAPR